MTHEENINDGPENNDHQSDVIPQDTDQYMQPDFLIPLVTDPATLYNKLVESGVAPDEAHERLQNVQQTVAREIMAPEFVAQKSGEALESVGKDVEELVSVVTPQLKLVEKMAEDTTFKGIARDVTDLQRTVNIVRSYAKGESDFQRVRRALPQLEEFTDRYGKRVRGLADNVKSGNRAAVVIEGDFKETTEKIKESARSLHDEAEGVQLSPLVAYNQETLQAAQIRGAPTVREHSESCAEEYGINGDVIVQTQRNCEVAITSTSELGMWAKRIQVDGSELPGVNQMRQIVDYVREAVVDLERHGPSRRDKMEDATHKLVQVVRRIETKCEDGSRSQRKLGDRVGEVHKALNRVA